MGREELLAELLLERFGPVEELERERGPVRLETRRGQRRRGRYVPDINEIEERTA